MDRRIRTKTYWFSNARRSSSWLLPFAAFAVFSTNHERTSCYGTALLLESIPHHQTVSFGCRGGFGGGGFGGGGGGGAEDEMINGHPDKPHEKEDDAGVAAEDDDDDDGKIPTLFTFPEEALYDRYAACLAATEGLRKIRDKELLITKPSRGLTLFSSSNKKEDKEGKERANSKYILKSTKVIKALGMTIPQFNQLGREVMANDNLKEKVVEQAYLYRITSTLAIPNNRVHILTDPKSSQLLNAHRRHRVQMFARSISDIEELRNDQMDRLKKALQIPTLPEGVNICDPNVLPLLSPRVRAVCEAFPLQAEDIVRKYGLNSDEFNEMLEKTKRNPLFRRRVKSEMQHSSHLEDSKSK